MKAKIVFLTSSIERVEELRRKHSLMDTHVSGTDDGKVVVSAYPMHFHTRFALAEESDVVVVPSPSDPQPIGDACEHFAHVNARSHHTGREVGLALHEKHGPAFHPET